MTIVYLASFPRYSHILAENSDFFVYPTYYNTPSESDLVAGIPFGWSQHGWRWQAGCRDHTRWSSIVFTTTCDIASNVVLVVGSVSASPFAAYSRHPSAPLSRRIGHTPPTALPTDAYGPSMPAGRTCATVFEPCSRERLASPSPPVYNLILSLIVVNCQRDWRRRCRLYAVYSLPAALTVADSHAVL